MKIGNGTGKLGLHDSKWVKIGSFVLSTMLEDLNSGDTITAKEIIAESGAETLEQKHSVRYSMLHAKKGSSVFKKPVIRNSDKRGVFVVL
jgi:hypothetical protein